MTAETAFVVVDTWRVKPGCHAELARVLGESAGVFRQQPGVLSVDYARLNDDPNRYLVVFRYASREAREAFRATPALTETMTRLSALWDLEGELLLGYQTGL
jgi:quinol monooxygenase YgiN